MQYSYDHEKPGTYLYSHVAQSRLTSLSFGDFCDVNEDNVFFACKSFHGHLTYQSEFGLEIFLFLRNLQEPEVDDHYRLKKIGHIAVNGREEIEFHLEIKKPGIFKLYICLVDENTNVESTSKILLESPDLRVLSRPPSYPVGARVRTPKRPPQVSALTPEDVTNRGHKIYDQIDFLLGAISEEEQQKVIANNCQTGHLIREQREGRQTRRDR
jgi:hypothetical protein